MGLSESGAALGILKQPRTVKHVPWHATYLPLGLGVLHRISRVLDELLLPPDDRLAGVSCIRQSLRHQDTSACSICSSSWTGRHRHHHDDCVCLQLITGTMLPLVTTSVTVMKRCGH